MIKYLLFIIVIESSCGGFIHTFYVCTSLLKDDDVHKKWSCLPSLLYMSGFCRALLFRLFHIEILVARATNLETILRFLGILSGSKLRGYPH